MLRAHLSLVAALVLLYVVQCRAAVLVGRRSACSLSSSSSVVRVLVYFDQVVH